jgi:integrase
VGCSHGADGRNVADVVTPPKREQHEAKALSVEEAQRLIDGTRKHRFGPLFMFALATGMRRGEIVALRSDAVDLTARTAIVRASASWAFNSISEEAPKSGRVRSVDLSDLAIEALRVQRARQAQERSLLGPRTKPTASPSPTRMEPKRIRERSQPRSGRSRSA